MLDIDNPFANYGHIVSGSRFIGRQDYLQRIESRVIRPPGGNLAIVGQRRVGKSSLAHQAVITRRDELLQQRILPIDMIVSTYDSPQQFFCNMVSICFRQLEDQGWAGRPIREAADEVKTRDIEHFDFGLLKEFFDQIQIAHIRIIFVLDEFDAAARYFEGDNQFFDRLRDLSYRGQTTLLILSYNPINVIERKANISSTLVGICDDKTLGMFEESEINDYFDRLTKAGISLTSSDRQQIMTHCGGHPFLHDKVAFELVEIFRHDKQIQVGEALQRSEDVFMREFKHIIEHLRDRGLLEPLMQALFTSPTKVKSAELKEIKRYGLIQESGSGYRAFSNSFQEHLRQEQPVQIEELSPTERRVLYCLTSDMQNKEIAYKLNMGENTVKTHISNIIRKLQVNNRHEAVRRARERKIIE
jgi:DNA-binding CsgD family transcriptional regulator